MHFRPLRRSFRRDEIIIIIRTCVYTRFKCRTKGKSLKGVLCLVVKCVHEPINSTRACGCTLPDVSPPRYVVSFKQVFSQIPHFCKSMSPLNYECSNAREPRHLIRIENHLFLRSPSRLFWSPRTLGIISLIKINRHPATAQPHQVGNQSISVRGLINFGLSALIQWTFCCFFCFSHFYIALTYTLFSFRPLVVFRTPGG